MTGRRLTGRTLHRYFNPQRSSHPDAVKVHGLTDEFLADKPLFHTVADELIAFVTGAEVIAHNANFDVGFLNAELRRLDRPAFHSHTAKVTDSLMLARETFPGKANSLDALCKRLEVDLSSRTLHGALLDAGLLAEVYIRMTRGQNALMIDGGEVAAAQAAIDSVDFAGLELRVLVPNAGELAAHIALMAELDKASGGKDRLAAVGACGIIFGCPRCRR